MNVDMVIELKKEDYSKIVGLLGELGRTACEDVRRRIGECVNMLESGVTPFRRGCGGGLENITEWLGLLPGRSFDVGEHEAETGIGWRWTWVDDEGQRCGESALLRLSFGTDCNGCEIPFAEFDDRSCTLESLDYDNVYGCNFCEMLFDEFISVLAEGMKPTA